MKPIATTAARIFWFAGSGFYHHHSLNLTATIRAMSALGHKQTYAPQKVMSALPPKADITQRGIFAKGQKRHTSYVATWMIITLKSSCVRKCTTWRTEA